jgi:SAM-dependent methyltransferase
MPPIPQNSWEESWQAGRTPWDAGGPAAELVALIEVGRLPKGRALVPGCGSGYDVLALAGPGRQALGLDLAPTAVARFPALREAAGISADAAEVIEADYFDYRPAEPFDLIWDYTFLCAIPPALREAWARQAHALLRPGGELVTLIYPVLAPPGQLPAGPIEGPPFALDPYAVRALLAPWFEEIELRPAEQSHPARGGREWLGRWRRIS